MKVTEVKYLKRFNLGNYEHEEFGVTAMVDEDDNVAEALEEVKTVVAAAASQKSENSEENEEENQKTEIGRGSKNPKRSQKAKKVEEEDEDEVEKEDEDEVEKEDEDEVEKEDEDEVEKEDEDEVEEEEKPKSKGKRGKSKASTYVRTDDLHRKLVGEFLEDELPGWDKKFKAGCLAASKKLNGTDFLDESGEILPAFKKQFLKLAKAK